MFDHLKKQIYLAIASDNRQQVSELRHELAALPGGLDDDEILEVYKLSTLALCTLIERDIKATTHKVIH